MQVNLRCRNSTKSAFSEKDATQGHVVHVSSVSGMLSDIDVYKHETVLRPDKPVKFRKFLTNRFKMKNPTEGVKNLIHTQT